MKILLSADDSIMSFMGMPLLCICLFIIGIFIVRWIFGIDKIIGALQKQNDYTLVQVRLLKRMLINQGMSADEVDDIISNGNKRNNTNKQFLNNADGI